MPYLLKLAHQLFGPLLLPTVKTNSRDSLMLLKKLIRLVIQGGRADQLY